MLGTESYILSIGTGIGVCILFYYILTLPD